MSVVILDKIILQYVSPDFNEIIPSIGLRIEGDLIEIFVRNTESYIGLNETTERRNMIRQDIIDVVKDYMSSLSVASAIYESPHVAMFVKDAHVAPGYRKFLNAVNPTPMESNSQYWFHSILPSSVSYSTTISVDGDNFKMELNFDNEEYNYTLTDQDLKFIFDRICKDDPLVPLLPASTPAELAANNILRNVRAKMDAASILINKVADDIMPDAASVGELLSDEELLNSINSKDSMDEKNV